MPTYADLLCPEKAYIWRITHRDNLAWIFDNGLHCASSGTRDAGFVSIGNTDLISKRAAHVVPIPPGGTLSDYVPFYFTPFSPMLLNIKSGRHGVTKRANDEIVILVADLHTLSREAHPFIYTNGHAYMRMTDYFSGLGSLDSIDWKILQQRNFSSDPNDPRKMERYQAEALVHRHLPVVRLRGVVCASETVKTSIEPLLAARGLRISVLVRPSWYF